MTDDLRAVTLRWARKWWDRDQHMVWNPAGGLSPELPARSVHLVPNTAWLAFALLGEDSVDDYNEAVAAIEQLLALQYDDPGKKFHGTFAQFLETPYPPEDARMWIQYDPNWRQFVGTAFAVILEDFADVLPSALVTRVESSIRFACDGEVAEGRLAATYANPALMGAWLDAWLGRRIGNEELVARGEDFAHAIAEEHDRFGAFEEFNSPTYYGIDLYALRLWITFPPTPYFADEGLRLETAVWRHVAAGYHRPLCTYCGPYTRSYHPDATRSVALFALWQWALFGRAQAPLPPLESDVIDHCHDLMAGPIFARLAAPPQDVDLAAFTGFSGVHRFEQQLPSGRVVTGVVHEELVLGAESSDNDWGGWAQFMPLTAHWRERDGVGALWLRNPHVVHATAHENAITLAQVDAPVSFALSGAVAETGPGGFTAGRLTCTVTGATATLASPKRVVLTPTSANIVMTFSIA